MRTDVLQSTFQQYYDNITFSKPNCLTLKLSLLFRTISLDLNSTKCMFSEMFNLMVQLKRKNTTKIGSIHFAYKYTPSYSIKNEQIMIYSSIYITIEY